MTPDAERLAAALEGTNSLLTNWLMARRQFWREQQRFKGFDMDDLSMASYANWVMAKTVCQQLRPIRRALKGPGS